MSSIVQNLVKQNLPHLLTNRSLLLSHLQKSSSSNQQQHIRRNLTLRLGDKAASPQVPSAVMSNASTINSITSSTVPSSLRNRWLPRDYDAISGNDTFAKMHRYAVAPFLARYDNEKTNKPQQQLELFSKRWRIGTDDEVPPAPWWPRRHTELPGPPCAQSNISSICEDPCQSPPPAPAPWCEETPCPPVSRSDVYSGSSETLCISPDAAMPGTLDAKSFDFLASGEPNDLLRTDLATRLLSGRRNFGSVAKSGAAGTKDEAKLQQQRFGFHASAVKSDKSKDLSQTKGGKKDVPRTNTRRKSNNPPPSRSRKDKAGRTEPKKSSPKLKSKQSPLLPVAGKPN